MPGIVIAPSSGKKPLYVLDHARTPPDLMIKEAIHIETTPLNSLINRDKCAEIPGCWVATITAYAQKQP